MTQPRRVAVTSTAKRIAEELNVELGGDIGYQVRHDKRVGDTPRIKFCTDGILLREIQADLLLRKYSVIIVDEAHERSVNTDILLGLLSRIVPLRAALTKEKNNKNVITPLRLVVMSATLRIEEFVNYFKYDYPDANGEHPFSITTEISRAPWAPAHRLVHIGLQAKKIDRAKLPPNNLVFLLDVSGSMNNYDKLPLLKAAFRLLVNNLRADDRVAIAGNSQHARPRSRRNSGAAGRTCLVGARRPVLRLCPEFS